MGLVDVLVVLRKGFRRSFLSFIVLSVSIAATPRAQGVVEEIKSKRVPVQTSATTNVHTTSTGD